MSLPEMIGLGFLVKVAMSFVAFVCAMSFVAFVCVAVSGAPNVTMLGVICQQGADASESWRHMKFSVRSTLIEFTSRNLGNYYMSAGEGTLTCYCHATCKRHLSSTDCVTCLQVADATITQRCGMNAVGGQVRLVDCHMRYETYRFSEG